MEIITKEPLQSSDGVLSKSRQIRTDGIKEKLSTAKPITKESVQNHFIILLISKKRKRG